jgi:hypothetical protein
MELKISKLSQLANKADMMGNETNVIRPKSCTQIGEIAVRLT